jgi:hypothetical protein
VSESGQVASLLSLRPDVSFAPNNGSQSARVEMTFCATTTKVRCNNSVLFDHLIGRGSDVEKGRVTLRRRGGVLGDWQREPEPCTAFAV